MADVPAEPAVSDRDAHRTSAERDANRVESEATRSLEDLYDRETAIDLQHDAVADLAGVEPDLDDFVPPDAVHLLDAEQWSLDRPD